MSSPAASTSLAPRPLMSLAKRLRTSAVMQSSWSAFLPQQLQQEPERLAALAAAVPAVADNDRLPPLESLPERKRSNSSSTCSTASGDAQSEGSSDDEEGPIAGQVWELSQDPVGCRRVQQALEDATCEADRCAIATELVGYELQAMRSPHANHVLQKCVSTMQPESVQFIVDALTQREGMISQVARHRYGCRIIQHLLKACPPSQVSKIAESVLEEASTLACHASGNYAVQFLMKFGGKEHKYQLTRCIEHNAAGIGRSLVGGAVIECAITHAASEDKVWIARAVANEPDVLLTLAKSRLGHSCALLVLETLPVREGGRISEMLIGHLEDIRTSRFGSQVAQKLENYREESC